jgi:hypothetical protein
LQQHRSIGKIANDALHFVEKIWVALRDVDKS